MPITIIDVAKQAGVSKSTVSKVLRGEPFVRAETEQKVREAMEALGYRPNAVARSLAGRTTRTIGVVIEDISNPYYAEQTRAIEDTALANGYSIIVCSTDLHAEREESVVEMLLEKQVDGIIHGAIRVDASYSARSEGTHFVLVGRRRPGAGTDYVVADDRQGARLAVEHLIELGHRRIGHIMGYDKASSAIDRAEAFREVMRKHGLDLDPKLIVKGGFDERSGYDGARELLALPQPPTAIFAANDIQAFGVMRAVEESGLRIPGDISLVGFDNTTLSAHTRINLTTVEQPLYRMGQMATEVLIDKIERRREGVRTQLVVDTKLIVRAPSLPG